MPIWDAGIAVRSFTHLIIMPTQSDNKDFKSIDRTELHCVESAAKTYLQAVVDIMKSSKGKVLFCSIEGYKEL